MNIDINFEDRYILETVADDLREFTFKSPISKTEFVTIVVEIESAWNPFIPKFLNLAYGPEKDGQIDDFAAVPHVNPSKALTTVLYCGLLFLKHNPGEYLGIDGSDFRRAYLYYRTLQRNYNYLTDHFKLYGLKYYARVLRGRDKNDFLEIDPDELVNISSLIENKPLTNHKSLFNYFIFYLK
jgi:hypothetical protein